MSRLHPFLFALFLVVSAAYEVRPLVNLPEAALCAAFFLLVTAALFILLRARVGHAGKAALLTTVLLAFLGFSGEVSHQIARLAEARGLPVLDRPIWGFLLAAAAAIVGIRAILRSRRDWGSLNQAVGVAVVALLASALGAWWMGNRDADWRNVIAEEPVALSVTNRPPDIYYLVLDSYTSLDALSRYWSYESAELREFLARNGFRVNPRARSEYRYTTFSLGARFNMHYAPQSFWNWKDRYTRNVMIRIIEESAVPRMLEKAGYKIVNLSMTALGSEPPRYPILPLLCTRSVGSMLADRSFIRPFNSLSRWLKTVQRPDWPSLKRAPFLDLEAVLNKPCAQPRFVFSHSMMTHEPFVFNPDGSRRPGDATPATRREDYLAHTIYANRLLMRAVTRILAKSTQPPVIIIQGDHGFRFLDGAVRDEESYCMLNAILLPGLEPEEMSLPPVNTFPLVFNHLFNAGLPYETNAALARVIAGDVED